MTTRHSRGKFNDLKNKLQSQAPEKLKLDRARPAKSRAPVKRQDEVDPDDYVTKMSEVSSVDVPQPSECTDDVCPVLIDGKMEESSTPIDTAPLEESYSENAIPRSFTKTSRDKSSTVEKETPRVRRNEEETIYKQSILRMIKAAGLQSATGELIDTFRLLLGEVTSYMVDRLCVQEGQTITSEHIRRQIVMFLKDEQADIDQEMILHPPIFEKTAKPLLEAKKAMMKRDVLYYFQLFIESCLIRILQASDMISEGNKRTRVGGKDLLVAFSIFTM